MTAPSQPVNAQESIQDDAEVAGDWVSRLNGYSLRLWRYTHQCSCLTLKCQDRIAKRPPFLLVLHDVSYVDMPLNTGKIRARPANAEELERVRHAMGRNFKPSNVVAFCGTEKRVFLVEYGYVQWLNEPEQ